MSNIIEDSLFHLANGGGTELFVLNSCYLPVGRYRRYVSLISQISRTFPPVIPGQLFSLGFISLTSYQRFMPVNNVCNTLHQVYLFLYLSWLLKPEI